MNRLSRIWKSGLLGKAGIGCAGLFVFVCLCGALGNLIGPPQTAQTTATPVVAEVTAEPTATTAPTATIEPTAEPSPSPSPTVEPTTAPTGVPPTSTPNADAIPAYARQVAGPVGDVADGLQGFVELLQNAKPGDASWQQEVDAQIVKIRNGHEAVTKVENVPPIAQPAHDRLMEATGDCDEGTVIFTSAMDARDAAQLNAQLIEVRTLILSCGTGISEAQQMLQRAATP